MEKILKLNDYMVFSFGSLILTAIFMWEMYQLAMSVFRQQAAERENYIMKHLGAVLFDVQLKKMKKFHL